jgi:hypothetical protein
MHQEDISSRHKRTNPILKGGVEKRIGPIKRKFTRSEAKL